MLNLKIRSTEDTPEISLDGENHFLEIKGMSYPEDTDAFYTPIFSRLREYTDKLENQTITVKMELFILI